MTDHLRSVSAFIFVLLLVWLGANALIRSDIETRVARYFDYLLNEQRSAPAYR